MVLRRVKCVSCRAAVRQLPERMPWCAMHSTTLSTHDTSAALASLAAGKVAAGNTIAATSEATPAVAAMHMHAAVGAAAAKGGWRLR